MTAQPRPFYGPWIIAASFVTFGLASGLPYYNIAFFYDYLRDDHHWTQQMVTIGAPIAILLTIWAGPLLAHRFNPRYLIVAGTGLTCLAFQWFGHLHGSSIEYYAAWCVYMIGYLLSGPIPHQIIISNWYRRKRGQAMGIAYIGGALAGAIGNKLAPWLVSFMPYRSAIQVLGLLLLLAWPLALFVLKDRPEDIGQNPDGDAVRDVPALDAAGSLTFAELAQRSSFWLLLVGSAASIGSIASVNFLMKFVFEEQGFTNQAARDQIWSTASFAALISAIGGRIVVGFLADRMSRKTVMVVDLRAGGAGDSVAVSDHAADAAVRVPVRHRVRVRHGRRLHAHSADGRRRVRSPHAGAGDVRDRSRRHHHAVLVAEPDRAAARRVGRLRQRALGGVRRSRRSAPLRSRCCRMAPAGRLQRRTPRRPVVNRSFRDVVS